MSEWRLSQSGSVFRKIAMGSWWNAGDPSVYGLLEVNLENTLRYLSQKNYPLKITPAHLVGKAISVCLQERPEINGLIRRSRIYQRKSVDLFYQVNLPGKDDQSVSKAMLTGCTVRFAENKTLIEIATELEQKSKSLRAGEKGELTKSIQVLSYIPWSLMKWVLTVTSYLNYDLDLPMGWAGMPKDPFGSCMITNVGSLGVDLAWAPLIPYTKAPLLLTVGAIKKRPIVVDDKIEIARTLQVGVTFDHRFMDGIHAAAMSAIFKNCFEFPERCF
jgi:pyruvate dehydrogenase E2 component (dihydrolipoamide acetyltransferase)